MTTMLALVAALAFGSIPLLLGWRTGYNKAEMARQMGVGGERKRFDPEVYARQTGTGLKFNQILYGFLAWVFGGFVVGLFLGGVGAFLFAVGGGFLYYGVLASRRQAFRMCQAKDILRGLQLIETLVTQGKTLTQAIEETANSVSPDGKIVLGDLVTKLRTASPEGEPQVIREWTQHWDNPAVDTLAVALLAHYELHLPIGKLVGNLSRTLGAVIEVLARAREAAKGVEWQARFLAIFPPGVLAFMALTTPEMGRLYSENPIYLLPVLIGSALSYYMSMRMIQTGLSIEASMGLKVGSTVSPLPSIGYLDNQKK